MAEPISDVAPGDSGESHTSMAALRDLVDAHPWAAAALVTSVLLGAAVGYVLIGGDLSTPRRILGGALAGGGCWLLVMMGRVIG